jgi:hypothetical protein
MALCDLLRMKGPTDRPADQPIDRQTDRSTGRLTDRPADRPIDRQTDQRSVTPRNAFLLQKLKAYNSPSSS